MRDSGDIVITFGIVLIVVGFLLHIHILSTLGIFLLIVGLILALLGAAGRAVFGRRHYWWPPVLAGRHACLRRPSAPSINPGLIMLPAVRSTASRRGNGVRFPCLVYREGC
jgi:hypothetical protein